jgi:FMN phosphatase YigB (HAD superfamily)
MRQAERLGMTSRDLEKIIFESESSQRASTGEIPEEAHWQAVAKALGVSRQESDKITAEFFSGDRADATLLEFLRSLRPERKVGLISNAWSGLRAFITSQRFEDVFDEMIISAEFHPARQGAGRVETTAQRTPVTFHLSGGEVAWQD